MNVVALLHSYSPPHSLLNIFWNIFWNEVLQLNQGKDRLSKCLSPIVDFRFWTCVSAKRIC